MISLPNSAAKKEYAEESIRWALTNPDPYYPNCLTQEQHDVVRLLLMAYPSAVVPRKALGEFSGGVLHPRTMANRNSKQKGLRPLKGRHGRQVVYLAVDAALYVVGAIPANA